MLAQWVGWMWVRIVFVRGAPCEDALWLQSSLLETWFLMSLHSSPPLPLPSQWTKQMEPGHGNDKKMH